MNIHLTLKSRNTKTGAIPVSTTAESSCPKSCPFKKNGCYAELGHVGMFWRKVTDGKYGTSTDQFCDKIKFWRKTALFYLYKNREKKF